ncbi:MAG: HD domain-containing protein [Rhodocyclaceae bacterium]|jgi:hypothetical protein|nr:HD domain-containing protein [Rhodocyclaceae bacterium]
MHASALAYAETFGSAYANTLARPAPIAPERAAPCDRLAAIAAAYVEVIEHWSCTVEDVIRFSTLAAELVGLVELAPAVCLGMAPHLPFASPSLRHTFAAAVLGIRLGQAIRLDARRQHTVAKAALFMNLPSLELQDDLVAPYAVPSDAQRITLARHPQLAADLLRDSPGTDLAWIEAVLQHHESLDGSGYPAALAGDEICLEARILKIADVWYALVAPQRLLRSAKTPRAALHWLLSRNRQQFDARLIEALRRVTGICPPGTVVRLANRETALVVDAPHGMALPRQAISILGVHGRLLRDPVRRDTRRAPYAIRDITALKGIAIPPAFWRQLWTLAESSAQERRSGQ